MAKKSKQRARGKLSARKKSTRSKKRRFLIVCEGEKTETLYFENFSTPKLVCEVYGVGRDTTILIKEARKRAAHSKYDYDQIWLVMDKDDFPSENFNRALTLADKEGMQVAYSNQAFELWFLLHFHYFNTGMSRQAYRHKLSSLLGQEYEKNDVRMYDQLEDRQLQAIKHAKKLRASYGEQHRPAYDDPCTTVYQLVEELRRDGV